MHGWGHINQRVALSSCHGVVIIGSIDIRYGLRINSNSNQFYSLEMI